MNLDAALAVIASIDGTGVDLGARQPVWPDFPIEEYQRRYARLAALMDREGFDALVLTQEEPVRYLSGYNSVIWAVGRWLPTVLVATRDPRNAALIASSFDAGCAAGTSWVGTVDTYGRAAEIPAKVREHLSAAGAARDRVGIESGPGSFMALPLHLIGAIIGTGHEQANGAGDRGPGTGAATNYGAPRDCGRLISALRMLKSPLELERVRRSVTAAVAGLPGGPGRG